MKALLNSLRRFSLTGVMVLAALWAGYKLWDYYMDAPWTRDGHVRADVVPVAPDVSGFVTEVLVRDNQQVQRGDVLFRIDRARYEIALKQAEAVLLGKRAMLDAANADLTRYSALTPGVVVSKQRMDQVVATQGSAQAAHDQAVADLGLARLNLARSEVRPSVNGVVTNMELRPGTYLTPGKGVMALLDSDTLRVEGYFEETKLSRIHLGDAANVRLMGSHHTLRGIVESVAAGIEDKQNVRRDVTHATNLLRLAVFQNQHVIDFECRIVMAVLIHRRDRQTDFLGENTDGLLIFGFRLDLRGRRRFWLKLRPVLSRRIGRR